MKTKKNVRIIFTLLVLSLKMAVGQQILLDKPVRVGELTVFPDIGNPNNYYYLPDKPKLGLDASGRPQFSFLRYVQNTRTGADQAAAREGDGGGIIHAVIQLNVSNTQLNEAKAALRRINPNGVIQGPIIYNGGTISLISSVMNPEGGLAQKVLGIGKAPILDGSKAAVSIQLTKLGAKILWESFQTPTPDMSISFEMELKGFRSPKRALIEANFETIYQHQSMQAAIASPVLAAEINTAFDDLQRSGAIKVTLTGADESMERAIDAAYEKLTRMMFDPVGGSGTPDLNTLSNAANGNRSLLDRATQMLNTARQETRQDNERRRRDYLDALNPHDMHNLNQVNGKDSSRFSAPLEMSDAQGTNVERSARAREQVNELAARQEALPQIAIAAVFEMKRTRQTGVFRIDLNKFTIDNLTIRFDENFGQINCKECFRQVNLDDPLYRQREINAFLDGMNSEDFSKYINFVTVQLRKKHETGDFTDDEVRIDKANFNLAGNNFKMLYGWKNDNGRQKWLNYDYKIVWNFFGGQTIVNDWKTTDISTVPLSPPFLRRTIDLEVDPTAINASGVRSIEIKVFYKQGEQEMNRQVRLNTKANQFSTQIEIIQAKNVSTFDYDITWFFNDGGSKNSGRLTTDKMVLFADNIPK
jgi:hypothetical protein